MHARTCYHHLAGQLGVALFDRVREIDGLSLARDAIRLNPHGQQLLRDAGLLSADDDLTAFPGRSCLDWTERRFHLGGPLGTQLTHRLFDVGWLRRRDGTRALAISVAGRAGAKALGLRWEYLRA